MRSSTAGVQSKATKVTSPTTTVAHPSTTGSSTSSGSNGTYDGAPTTVSPSYLPPTPSTTQNASGYSFVGSPHDPEPYQSTDPAGLFFTSPDGSFTCGILPASTDNPDGGTAGYQGSTSPVPPRPSTCPPQGPGWGQGMQVHTDGTVNFLCTGGVIYAANSGAGPALPDGSTLTGNGFVCTSTSGAVSCLDRQSGHGFSIAATWNTTF